MPPQTTLKHLSCDRALTAHGCLLGMTTITVPGSELADIWPREVLHGGGLRRTQGAAGARPPRGDQLRAAGEAWGQRRVKVHRAQE